MPKSTGIYKRKLKSGWRYYAKVYYKTRHFNVPGGYKTEAEVKVARAEYLKKLVSNELTVKKKITVEEFSKIFLENYGSHWRAGTYISKKSYINQYINPAIGFKQINSVTPMDIQLIKKKPKPRKTDVDPYKIIEIIDDIKSACDKTIIALGFYGGLRLSEIFGLQRKHVYIKNSTLTIEKQYIKGILGPPKSESSQATIHILPLLSRILQCGSSTWLFPGRKKDILRAVIPGRINIISR